MANNYIPDTDKLTAEQWDSFGAYIKANNPNMSDSTIKLLVDNAKAGNQNIWTDMAYSFYTKQAPDWWNTIQSESAEWSPEPETEQPEKEPETATPETKPLSSTTEYNTPVAEAKVNTQGVSAASGDYKGVEAASEVQQAIAEGAQEAQSNATNAAAASASAGINKSRAGMLSDQGTQASSTNNVSNMYAANTSQAASTQADYLQRMSQADALEQKGKQMQQGLGWTTAGSVMQGIGQGASTGASLGSGFSSDENVKTDVDGKDLLDKVKQFRELYKRLQELKR